MDDPVAKLIEECDPTFEDLVAISACDIAHLNEIMSPIAFVGGDARERLYEKIETGVSEIIKKELEIWKNKFLTVDNLIPTYEISYKNFLFDFGEPEYMRFHELEEYVVGITGTELEEPGYEELFTGKFSYGFLCFLLRENPGVFDRVRERYGR